MRRVLSGAILILATGAHAAGYDDFARGLDANNVGASEVAISSFSAALEAGDLAPAFVPQAYRGRATAYLRLNKCVPALSDIEAALKLEPNRADLKWMHASAEMCVGGYDAAIADYDTVIAADPSESQAYFDRGTAKWRAGRYADAAADFRKYASLDDGNSATYGMLWAVMSDLRATPPDTTLAARDAATGKTHDWPGPVFDFFLGKIAAPDVMAAAAAGDADTKSNRQCEADFYVAEWWLARGNPVAARPLLKTAVGQCPRDFIEYGAARFALSRLNQTAAAK
jgi:lipoprotein NlpI